MLEVPADYENRADESCIDVDLNVHGEDSGVVSDIAASSHDGGGPVHPAV